MVMSPMNIEACYHCGLNVWHLPDEAFLAELAGEAYIPECWSMCHIRDTAQPSVHYLDHRQPAWSRPGWRVPPTPGTGRHMYGIDRHYTFDNTP